MSDAAPFASFYASDLQGVWLLLVAPLAYLGYRAFRPDPGEGRDPGAARFVSLYTLLFAAQTIVDPIATGPLARALGTDAAKTGLSLTFVLLGDWRVYWLVFAIAALRGAAGWAALASLAVPVTAWLLARAAPDAPDQVLWALHELLFLVATLVLRRLAVPRAAPALRPFVRDVLDYVALYYGLWALADVAILGGADWGWALRVVPNQLYYAFFVPFVHWRFFASSSAPRSTDTQAPR